MDTTGGYDFEIVGSLVKEYECPICLLLIKDAIELPCTHALCKTCLNKWENEPSDSSALQCPSCKAVYQQVQVKRSILDRIITTSLQVKCKESKKGCQWIGTISDYNDHEKKCLFQTIECDFVGCEERVIRSVIEEHKMICSFRLVYCSYCGEEEQFHNLEVHYQTCISYPVRCLNKECNVTMARKELDTHIQNTCDFQLVTCEYKSVGCNVNVHRKDLQIHLDTSVHRYMILLLTHSALTTVRLTTTEQNLEITAANLQLTTEELEDTKNELKTTRQELMETIEREKKSEENLRNYLTMITQKFEERTMKIEDNCIQSTKILAIHTEKPTITIELENSFEELIKVLRDEEWKEYKEEHVQQKELDIESILEKEFKIQIAVKSINQQHRELLKGIKRTWMVATNITEVPYPLRFKNLLHSMETYQLYYHNNNEIYVKVTLKEYVGKTLGVYMRDISNRNGFKTHRATKYYSDEMCLYRYNTDIHVYFLIPNWNNNNTNVFIINPQLDEKIQRGIHKGSYRFYDKLQQNYLSSDGEILIKLDNDVLKSKNILKDLFYYQYPYPPLPE